MPGRRSGSFFVERHHRKLLGYRTGQPVCIYKTICVSCRQANLGMLSPFLFDFLFFGQYAALDYFCRLELNVGTV